MKVVKKVPFLLAFLTIALASKANYRIDSLKTELAKSAGLQRVGILNEISVLYRNTNTERAMYYAKEAVQLATEEDLEGGLGTSLLNLGIVHRTIGQSDQALDCFMEALDIAEKKLNSPLKADVLHKIGVTYLLVNNFTNALNFAEQELPIWKDINNTYGWANALNLKGISLLNLNQFEEAEDALTECLEKAYEINDPRLIYKPLVNLGDLYLKLNQPEKAIDYINESLEVSEQTNNKFGLSAGYLKLGDAFHALDKFDAAIESIRKGLRISEELNSISLVRNSYRAFATIYEDNEDFKSALIYNKLYIATEDSMINHITRRKIAEISIKYQIREKEQEIETLIQQSKFSQLRITSISLIVLLASILSFVWYNRSKIKKSSTQQIRLKGEEMEEKQKELIDKQKLIDFTINYSKNIQNVLLPESPAILNIFSDHFLYKKSAQSISTDFAIFTHSRDNIIMAIADCNESSLHGTVKNLFIASLIKQVILENSHFTPADMLSEINSRLSKLNMEGKDVFDDGIDMAIISINTTSKRLVYSGANIPLYHIKDQGLQIVSPDHIPVGGSHLGSKRSFNNKTFSLAKQEKLLVFTDGLYKQKGGNDHLTFSEKKVRHLLSDISQESLNQQQNLIVRAFEEWKGERTYTDDVLILGVEI